MNTKEAVAIISVGVLACACTTFLIHSWITRPCVEVIHKYSGAEDHSRCPVGASAEMLSDEIMVCRCPGGTSEVEAAVP